MDSLHGMKTWLVLLVVCAGLTPTTAEDPEVELGEPRWVINPGTFFEKDRVTLTCTATGATEFNVVSNTKHRADFNEQRGKTEQIIDSFSTDLYGGNYSCTARRDGKSKGPAWLRVAAQVKCEVGFTKKGNFCYKLLTNNPVPFYGDDSVEEECSKIGGLLAVPNTHEDNADIRDMMKSKNVETVWLGGRRKYRHEDWEWTHSWSRKPRKLTSRSNIISTNDPGWKPGSPRDEGGLAEYMVMTLEGWDNVVGSSEHHVICQIQTTPPSYPGATQIGDQETATPTNTGVLKPPSATQQRTDTKIGDQENSGTSTAAVKTTHTLWVMSAVTAVFLCLTWQ